jgi:hypothetical protein
MGPVGHAGERAPETEARTSNDVAAHTLYQTLSKGISGQPAPEEINLAWEDAAA